MAHAKLPPPTSKRLAKELEQRAIERAGGIENYRNRKPYMTVKKPKK